PQTSRHDRATNPKLLLWNTIRLSYSSYFHNFPDVLRISWLWLVAAGVLSWLRFTWIAGVVAAMKQGMAASKPVETTVVQNLVTLVSLLVGVSIAVAWHGRFVLEERPGLSGSNVAIKSLWRYAWMGLAIGLVVFLPTIVLALPMFALMAPATGSTARF